MELYEIKELVNHFEEKIITKFEENFSELVLSDFYGGGYDERIEDEFFYDEYFEMFEEDIINLLRYIEDCYDDEYFELKIRLIKMKRKIDTYMCKLEKRNSNDGSLRVNRKSQFILNNKIVKEYFIEILHDKLIQNKLISDDLKTFRKHFDIKWDDKIQWLGTEIQICNLFHLLIENKFLRIETQNFKHKLVCNHFINRKGNVFKEKQLGSVFSDKKVLIPDDDVIIKIIEELVEEMSTD